MARLSKLFITPRAHTDGDSIVFFSAKADAIAAGDIIDKGRVSRQSMSIGGGSVQGELTALNRLVELAVSRDPRSFGAKAVPIRYPGTAALWNRPILSSIATWSRSSATIVQDLVKQGMTLDQIKKAEPTKALSAIRGKLWTIQSERVRRVHL